MANETQAMFRAAVLMLTTEQARQSWQRENEAKRAAGLPFYERLVDVVTGAVVCAVR